MIPASGFHFTVLFFNRVQNSIELFPVISPTPNLLSFHPPNENGSRGTGTPTFTPDHPGTRPVDDIPRERPVLRKDRRRIPVRAGIFDRDGFIQRPHPHNTDHGPKNLFRRDRHLRPHIIDHRRPDIRTALPTRDRITPPVDQHLRALLLPLR